MSMSPPPAAESSDDRPARPEEVTLGIIAALPIEAAAMLSVIDALTSFSDPDDQHHYDLGRLPSAEAGHPHTVAVMTMNRDGTRLAATYCTTMLHVFPNIRTVVMVGIAGGIPRPRSPQRHVRLGDIVVATDGIVDYGHVSATDTGNVLRGRQGGGLVAPRLVEAANRLRTAEQRNGDRPWEDWLDPKRPPAARFPRPMAGSDVLRVGVHEIPHPARPASAPAPSMPRVHYGTVGSADVLLKTERVRDELAERYSDMVAVEMEGSGIAASTAANERSWFMVRGIADYAATDKNEEWHPYASYTAAVYVRALLGATAPLSTPRTQVSGRSLPLVGSSEQDALDRLLRDVPRETDLRRIWQETVPELPDPDPLVFSTAGHVYHHLARLNARSDEPHPAFTFIDRLGRALSGHPAGSGLVDWAAAKTGPIGAGGGQQDPGNRARTARPALILRITVDGIDRNVCRIAPYLQTARGPWQPVPGPTEPVEVPITRLETATAALVARAEELWIDTAERADIEFVLPAALLNLAVQHFDGPRIFGQSQPLGVGYAVSVRSLDRMIEPRARRVWAHRWQQLDRQPYEGRVLWASGTGTANGLRNWATNLAGDDKYLVVILSAPPDAESGNGELRAALRSGVPIILWDQRGPRPADATAGIQQLVDEPTGLPENTRQARVQAEQSPTTGPAHFGRSVALLWDDPNRLITDRRAES